MRRCRFDPGNAVGPVGAGQLAVVVDEVIELGIRQRVFQIRDPGIGLFQPNDADPVIDVQNLEIDIFAFGQFHGQFPAITGPEPLQSRHMMLFPGARQKIMEGNPAAGFEALDAVLGIPAHLLAPLVTALVTPTMVVLG